MGKRCPHKSKRFRLTLNRGHRRLAVWLVGAHLVVGLVLGGITRWSVNIPPRYPDYAVFLLAGFVFAQACLVGIWGALGSGSWVIRLIGVAVGVPYLGLVFGFAIDELDFEIVLMVAATAVSVASPLLVTRHFGAEVISDRTNAPMRPQTQFSIRQLMLLTAVVACLLTLGRWLRPGLVVNDAVFVGVVAGTFAVIGVAAPWSLIGAGRMWATVPVLFGLAVAVAFAPPRLTPAEDTPLWATATLTEALTLTVTLGVLRYRGYQLRRQRR